MRVRKGIIILILALSFVTGLNAKQRLFVIDSSGNTINFSKDDIFVTPQYYRSPYIAFSFNGGKNITIYSCQEGKAVTFSPATGDLLSGTSSRLTFVTFCWDLVKEGHFVVVYAMSGAKVVFTGNVRSGNFTGSQENISDGAISFNYCNGLLSYVVSKAQDGEIDGNVYAHTIGKKPQIFINQPNDGRIIMDYKFSPATEEYFFVLRNPRTNDSGIYKGKRFDNCIVDDPKVDELYPHISPDGTLLGYIEREKKDGRAVICLKSPAGTKRSDKSFALEQNALLKEYQRMHFIGSTLYFYIDSPDTSATITTQGLSALSIGQPEKVYCPKYLNNLFNDGETGLNMLDNREGRYEFIIKKKSILKNMTPFILKGNPVFFTVIQLKSSIFQIHKEIASGFIDNAIIIDNNDLEDSK